VADAATPLLWPAITEALHYEKHFPSPRTRLMTLIPVGRGPTTSITLTCPHDPATGLPLLMPTHPRLPPAVKLITLFGSHDSNSLQANKEETDILDGIWPGFHNASLLTHFVTCHLFRRLVGVPSLCALGGFQVLGTSRNCNLY
jgi:hypothetical protein